MLQTCKLYELKVAYSKYLEKKITVSDSSCINFAKATSLLKILQRMIVYQYNMQNIKKK